jgi:NhaP-type Na+/H+ or K+/H+ antiporter
LAGQRTPILKEPSPRLSGRSHLHRHHSIFRIDELGAPTEGGEHPVRFALTTEAGLNDGLAFPFVYLGLIVGSTAFSATSLLTEWVVQAVFYRIVVGCLAGAAIGWLLGRLLFTIPGGKILAETGSGVLALAGVLLCYGTTELLEGYGFIACFVAGLTLRRVEADHQFHTRLQLQRSHRTGADGAASGADRRRFPSPVG